jgi:hypothetical protein
VVVGDGAVGLLGVLSARQMGAERIIAMSRHETRQQLAREFGATDVVTERGEEGVARIKDLTNGVGADAVLECVGTQESMIPVIRATRPGGYVPAIVLLACPSARRSSARSQVFAEADRPRVQADHQSREGVRPRSASRASGGGYRAIANAVLWLCSEAASFTVGHALIVDAVKQCNSYS